MKTIGLVIGALLIGLFWLLSAAASLAIPALAVWALGHFAFGWW